MKSFISKKQRFALRKIKSAKKVGLASVMLGLTIVSSMTGVMSNIAVHAATTEEVKTSKSDGDNDVHKKLLAELTKFDKLRNSDQTQKMSTLEDTLYTAKSDAAALTAKNDNFTRGDLENLVKLATSDSWKGKINNGDDEDMVKAHDAIDDAKMILAGEDPDSVKVAGADTMDVDRAARYVKKKTPKKISGEELNSKINAAVKRLKNAMIAIDAESKFTLNSMIKSAEKLVESGKIKDAALPAVQNALLNAKNVAGNLTATDEAVSDAQSALVHALYLAGYDVKYHDDDMDNNVEFVEIGKDKDDDGKIESDPYDSADDRVAQDMTDGGAKSELTQSGDSAIDEAGDDFSGDNAGAVDDDLGAALNDTSDADSDSDTNDDASDLIDQGEAIGDSSNDAGDGLYNYDAGKAKLKDDDGKSSDVDIKKQSDGDTLDAAIKTAGSSDMELKLSLADDATRDAFNKALDAAKNVDSTDKDAVKKADDNLLAAMNSVNTQAKGILTKQLAQINDLANSKDYKDLGSANQAVVGQVQQLVSTVSADPNASFADIVQAESAALNILGQANKVITPTSDQLAQQAEINKDLAKQGVKVDTGENDKAIDNAKSVISDVHKDADKVSRSDMQKANSKLINAQADGIAHQTELVGKDEKTQHEAASNTNLKSTDMVARDGGVKADDIGAKSASMNTQSDHAAAPVSTAPVAIEAPSSAANSDKK